MSIMVFNLWSRFVGFVKIVHAEVDGHGQVDRHGSVEVVHGQVD